MSSIWLNQKKSKNFPELSENLECDICIVGGGITGISCAYELCSRGYTVTLLEKNFIANNTSGNTTGKLTSQHNLFYDYLINSFGIDYAKKYLDLNESAISNIKDIIDKENINCDFEYQDSYVFTQLKNSIQKFQKEYDALKKLNFPAELLDEIPLPINIESAIKFPNQAQFNPVKYIDGLINIITKNNCRIFENSNVVDVSKSNNNYITSTKNNTITSKYVVLATSYPIINFPGFHFLKMYQSTSYGIALRTNQELFSGLYINDELPTLSFRTATYNNEKIFIVVGSDHKTGYSENNSFSFLESMAKKLYTDSEVLFKWSTEDCISVDKLPYIGPFSTFLPHVFIATGFKKWGMTLSNISSNIITDMICNENNNTENIFSSTRFHPIKNHKEVSHIAKQAVNSLIFNKLEVEKADFDSIEKNTGKIMNFNNQNIGVFRDFDNSLHIVKPVCPHLGCLLTWNDTLKNWDCPCHGSKFNYDGTCIYGPSVENLEKFELK